MVFQQLLDIHYRRVAFTVFEQIGQHQCHVGIGEGSLFALVVARIFKDESPFHGGARRCIVNQHGLAFDNKPGLSGLHLLVQLFHIRDVAECFFIETVGIEGLLLASYFGLLQDIEQVLVVALEVTYQPVERDDGTFLPVLIGYDRDFSSGYGSLLLVDRCTEALIVSHRRGSQLLVAR